MKYAKDVIIAVLVVAVAYLLATRDGTGVLERLSPVPPPSIAVLPFVNASSDEGAEYLADGISLDIAAALQAMEGVKTTSLASSSKYKGANQTIERIGLELGVDYMLEGSVRKDELGVRVIAQLIQVDDGFHVWSRSYEQPSGEIGSVPPKIAKSAVRIMQKRENDD